jgi:hypothetical protein
MAMAGLVPSPEVTGEVFGRLWNFRDHSLSSSLLSAINTGDKAPCTEPVYA